jgi:hypothetical protein
LRVGGWQLIGDLACALPTHPGRADVAIGQPRSGTHVPSERIVQIACGFEVLG